MYKFFNNRTHRLQPFVTSSILILGKLLVLQINNKYKGLLICIKNTNIKISNEKQGITLINGLILVTLKHIL
jgi:hypothetical protein